MKYTQRILITGATGFVGSALAEYFYQKGFIIRAMARNAAHPFVKNNPQYQWVFADLITLDENSKVCDEVDFVLHAAGFAHAAKNDDVNFKQKHQAINYNATVTLAKIAKKAKSKRFIFFSSVKAVADSDYCIDETWTKMPSDPYGLAKRQAEETLLGMDDLDVVILRLSLVYGAGWKGNLQTLLKAIDKNIFPPIPKLANQKSMVSLQDVCLATECAMWATLSTQRLFIVTDGQTYSTDQIDHIMRIALEKKIPRWSLPLWCWYLFGKMGDLFQKITGFGVPISTEALEKLFGSACYQSKYSYEILGFVPQYTLSDVMPGIVDAFLKD